jgi:hypothetical protein
MEPVALPQEDGFEIVPEAIVGVATTVTVDGAEVDVHPLPSVYVTVYDPALETVMVELVSVVDQTLSVAYDEVKSTEEPEQIVNGPDAVITGAVAGVNTETVV